MASPYVGFYCFPEDFLSGKHNFHTDIYKIALTNTLPDAATDIEFSDIVEITAENGYDAGGVTATLALNTVSDEAIVTGATAVFEADGGDFGPFEYAVLYNFSHLDQVLVGYWAYEGGSISVLDTETITMVFGGVNGVFKVSPA